MLPPGLLTVHLVGQYVRPDGSAHRGFVMITPELPRGYSALTASPDGVPVTVVLQTVRIDFGEDEVLGSGGEPVQLADGYVETDLLNPNDPSIVPGPGSGQPWMYRVREEFYNGPVLEWLMRVPEGVEDGGVVDLAKLVRHNDRTVRPADWYPKHLWGTEVMANRISPRRGPLMRDVDHPSGS